MGTFGGHAIPGSIFILFAVHLFINGVLRFCNCRRNNKPFTSTITFPDVFFCWRLREWPLDSIIRLALIIIAFTLEIYTGFHNGKFVHMGNAHHATMYAAFGMMDAVILLQHYTKHVPAKTEHVMFSFAFMIEGVLFSTHLHGRTSLDVNLHVLLVYVIFACALVTLVIVKYNHNILLFLTQAYAMMLQGTWFLQVGYILYNPIPGSTPWGPDDHNTMMWVPLLFAWHCIGILVMMLMVAGVIITCKGRQYTGSGNGMTLLLHEDNKGYTRVRTENYISESDLEFEKELL